MKLRALLLFVALWSQAAGAADPAPTTEIIVTGETWRAIERFVREAARPLGDGKQATWSGAFCPALAGFDPAQAQFVLERMNEVVQSIGIKSNTGRCPSNVLILMSEQAALLAERMVDEKFGLFGADRHLGALREFAQSEAPVRWWYVAKGGTADGVDDYQDGTHAAPTMTATGSRIVVPSKNTIERVIAVVDATRMHGVPIGVLAAYLTMASMVRVNHYGDLAPAASILTYFRDRAKGDAPATELTGWDRAFLKALYETPKNFDPGLERNVIAQRMLDELAAAKH
jgi:hypothetical protein